MMTLSETNRKLDEIDTELQKALVVFRDDSSSREQMLDSLNSVIEKMNTSDSLLGSEVLTKLNCLVQLRDSILTRVELKVEND